MKNNIIYLRRCRKHNLKNFSLSIPKKQVIVLTGISGSGKSSLAFDTIFAEGQRQYLEFLSPDIRASLKQMPKPDVDLIEGLSPTLAIGQGHQSLYARGTVGTYTDTYDFLSLLFARIGKQHSPSTGKPLIRYSRQEITELILKEYASGTRLQFLAPIKLNKETVDMALLRFQQMGFIRIKINGQDYTEGPLPTLEQITSFDVVVDRLEIKDGVRERLSSAIDMALDLSMGILKIQEGLNGTPRLFTEVYVCPETLHSFVPLETADFNFNSQRGACSACQGLGGDERFQRELFSWEVKTSLSEQVRALLDYFPKKIGLLFHSVWSAFLEKNGISDEVTVEEAPKALIQKTLDGSSDKFSISFSLDGEKKTLSLSWKGLIPLIEEALKDRKNRGRLDNLPFIQWQLCPICKGARLKPESLSCLIKGKNIYALCTLTISELISEISNWSFKGKELLVTKEILPHLLNRLHFLDQVGLGYLELSRPGNTLSDGEAQRVQLAALLGAKLSGLIYVLDEPSLGLHPQDIQHLVEVIQNLKNLDNTVILVEHERTLISKADMIIEIGPGAGIHGGHITFQGTYDEMLLSPDCLTGRWISGNLKFSKPPTHKPSKNFLSLHKATLHNLKNFSVDVPLGCLVGFCGVSGSGKSTLALDIISPEVRKEILRRGSSSLIKGVPSIERVVTSEKKNERISTRSMPATYIDILTPIRNLLAETRIAKARGYTAARFSLNKKGGRCEACEGLGQVRVSMQMMADLHVTCDVCNGLRYNYETLQVLWEGKNMAEILAMSSEEAYLLFKDIPSIAHKLELLNELGLEYLTLGQSFNTLSAGEIQRLRLVADLGLRSLLPTLYILDEPSAGLHFHDIQKLLTILHRLVDKGHSVFVIEHHPDILRQADWLIELGPVGGPKGGQLIFEGTVSKMKKQDTPTSRALF
jgi:excinuclease ABC subunit A